MSRRIVMVAAAALLVGAATSALAWRRHLAAERLAVRAAAYDRSVRSYAAIFKPGMTRAAVEVSLRHDGESFQQMCCMAISQGAYDDLIHIGDEKPPWFCSNVGVYVGLAFRALDSHQALAVAHPTDVLTDVRLFKWSQGCL